MLENSMQPIFMDYRENEIKAAFTDPPAAYRTAPLWVWNSEMSDAEIEKSLTELKNHGFGGAFVHPRPGMKVGYLDEPYFKAWKKALETAKRLGLRLNIYDENSYPSGFGGGHVSRELPDCLSESIRYQVIPAQEMDFSEESVDWLGNHDLIAAYACRKENEKMVLCHDVTEMPRSQWKGKGDFFAVITHLDSQTAGWLAGYADIDRLRPEVTETFLKEVYQAYAEHFGNEFGHAIQAIFTDEPSLPGSTVYGRGGKSTLPINHWFGYEFQKRKGYDIMQVLPCLFEDWQGYANERIRHDYYDVVQQLWTENFLRPISKWCKEHNIAFTGHFMEDGWPKPFYCVLSPGVMANYEYQDWPGIDLLQTGRLKDAPSEVQQISILEVMSAAHQFGKERVFCEAYGAGGYDSGLRDYKRIGDYLFANGINFINQHLTYTSYVGARKRDHPQSFDWRQPWWEEYTRLNDYLARLSLILSQGKSEERILVLNPTMTGWISPRNTPESQLVNNILAPDMGVEPFLQMIQDLRSMQWDINLGDEIVMKRHAKVSGGKLQIVQQRYDVVILHGCIQNMLRSTMDLLEEFMDQGGTVLCAGTPGNFIEGVPHPQCYKKFLSRERCLLFDSAEPMFDTLQTLLRPRFTSLTPLPEGVESLRRILADGREFFFLTNHSKQDVCTKAVFHGSCLEEWNPWDGRIDPVPGKAEEGTFEISLQLKDGQSRLFCIPFSSSGQVATLPAEPDTTKRLSPVQLTGIRPTDWNVWPLEYCDLYIDGECRKDYSVIAAGETIFKKRGFLFNPWDNAVQYKNRTYDRNRFFAMHSGFSATYSFTADPGYRPSKLLLAVEYAQRYRITVNGTPLGDAVSEPFLDPLILQYDIAPLIAGGENTITLTAHRFDVELELEPVILRGDFGVYARNGQWVMGPPPVLKTGDWTTQGYPFYHGAMVYEYSLFHPGGQSVWVEVPDTESTAISVSVNRIFAGIANIDGLRPLPIAPLLKTGLNKIEVRVCASMKNLLGPHFDPAHPRRTAWPDMWKRAPKYGPPLPEEYDLIPYGMQQDIKITTGDLNTAT